MAIKSVVIVEKRYRSIYKNITLNKMHQSVLLGRALLGTTVRFSALPKTPWVD